MSRDAYSPTWPWSTDEWAAIVDATAEAARNLRDLLRALDDDHCHGIVTRDFEQDVCGKPTTCVIDGRGTEAETFWPACTYHANRYGDGRIVPLSIVREVVAKRALHAAGRAS